MALKLRSDEHKRFARNYHSEKNEITEHCCEADQTFSWDQKKVVHRENRLIPRKIKETNHMRIRITLAKLRTCFLKYGFLVYGSSSLLIYATSENSS